MRLRDIIHELQKKEQSARENRPPVAGWWDELCAGSFYADELREAIAHLKEAAKLRRKYRDALACSGLEEIEVARISAGREMQ